MLTQTRIWAGAALVATIAMSACAPPKQAYRAPQSPAPPTWQTSTPGAADSAPTAPASTAPAATDVKWDAFFLDAKLRGVVDLALKNNRDLRMAALNVDRVQQQFRIQRAQQFPTVGIGANADAYRVPADMTKDDKANITNTNRVGVQVSSWELDLFGRVRSLKDAAWQQYLATEQGRVSTRMALISTVAASYLTLAADSESLRLAQATLDAQRSSYDLIQRTRDLGVKSDLDLRQAQSQVEAAQVDVVRYTAQLTLDRNALELLVAAPVPADLLPRELAMESSLTDINAGLSSDVLLRRPDILQAEYSLKAAYANIAAARAAYFPRITLTGGGGFTSGALEQLFSFRARTWEFNPQLNVPIFDMGTRAANHRIAQIDRDVAVADYEKSIQTAFREVSDSLSQRQRLLEQQNAQEALVKTLDATYRLADARYKAGIDNYLTVLVAQRSLYSGQLALVNIRLARMSNLVTLYKVLGGGAS